MIQSSTHTNHPSKYVSHNMNNNWN